MGGEMWRLRFTKLLLIASVLAAATTITRAQDERLSKDEIKAQRIQRDLDGVTTVLLVSARPGKAVPPVGILTKTARTFVQDGASTEYATQVVGTTLDNGRLYARILSTSSRVFYDKDPGPDSVNPYLVYPSRAPQNDWQFGTALDNAPIKAIKDIKLPDHKPEVDVSIVSAQSNGDESKDTKDPPPALDELLDRENDVFNKRELNVDLNRFKPAKVRPADNLPTYTIKPDYNLSGIDSFEEEQPKIFRPRAPKVFRPQPKIPIKKPDVKPLETVTYHGFADFTTTVGDTVIVFSPSTAPAPVGRPATTIKGDATLRPDDGVAKEIRPTDVIVGHKKTKLPTLQGHDQVEIHTDQRKTSADKAPRDPLLEAINGGGIGNLQPSAAGEVDAEFTAEATTPLLMVPDIETESLKPTGLLKTIDSTTAFDGTTTHYQSLIYGTYIGTNYARIIHTSSNVYFFPDEASVTYGTDDSTMEYTTEEGEVTVEDQGTTVQLNAGTTPKIVTTSEEATPEMNELTTPFKDTTEKGLTTLKGVLGDSKKVSDSTEPTVQAAPTTENEIANDIVPADPQGRSIKGNSGKNGIALDGKEQKVVHNFNSVGPEEKDVRPSLATRLLPSTVYKTFTYFTTFFIPDDNDQTTTSIRSREVISAEVTHLTELILPSATIEPNMQATAIHTTPKVERVTTPKIETSSNEPEEEETTKKDEEIELIFKTLYTTYTYLTTFFQESTSSVSSRQVVETNIITQTVGPDGMSADVAGLFDREESVLIAATKVSEDSLATVFLGSHQEEPQKPVATEQDTTEGSVTTMQDHETTVQEQSTTEAMVTEDESKDTNPPGTVLEASPTPALPSETPKEVKTYYTTYTYFTTIFVDDETETETRSEVVTNIVTEGIEPTAVSSAPEQTEAMETPETKPAEKPPVPPEILAYLEAIQKQKSEAEALEEAKRVQNEANNGETTEKLPETTMTEGTTEFITEVPTTLQEQEVTEKIGADGFQVGSQATPNPPVDGEVLETMITDVISSSSSGGGTVLDAMDKRNAVPDDQELSESNNHEVEPAPTLLLQTSYTTFTYFTTMYKGEASNVASRLETVTNIVTETIRPSAVLPLETSTLPVTYFTTFTYWTTLYKGGDTITTSREETVSNVMTPGIDATPPVVPGVVMTYTPTAGASVGPEDPMKEESKVTADNELISPLLTNSDKSTPLDVGTTSKDIVTTPENMMVVNASAISPEPTTFFTTFTYFTTSYIGNETVLNSRLETITSVANAADHATGRAIGGPVPGIQDINIQEKTKIAGTPASPKADHAQKTGLISTIRSSQVNDGTTTHFATDIKGTFIDGLYAQIVESSTKLETPSLSSAATPVLPTGVLSLNRGSIVDADEVSTVYFTTKQIGTVIDGLYAKVIESTSTTKIDEAKAAVVPTQVHKTGLVRLIQGYIEANGTTTFYQSKVIGTIIDSRYAQIIESTSSWLKPSASLNIAPTSTMAPSPMTGIPEISPSPAVIQSSLSDDPTTESSEHEDGSESGEEEGDEEEEDEDRQSSKKKSRLTFSSRKKTLSLAIRPFVSRSRPTFNPKRKVVQGATTITRAAITPTVTATLAGKGNRFASSRGRVSSPTGPYSATLAASGSRRFSGRRGSSSVLSPASTSGYLAGSTRGRGSSRISPSSVFPGGRRGSSSIRGSSVRPGPRGSSSIYAGASSRYRPGIRASSTLLRGQSSAKHDDQDDNSNDFTTTTLVTEETPYTDEEDGETVTAPLQTTTESSRRAINPLLRFRRPLTLGNNSARSNTTPRPATTTTTRRSANLSRPNSPAVPNRPFNNRSSNRPNVPISTRPRQGQNGLFPPRSLFNRKPEPTEEPIEDEEDFEGEDETESFEDEPVDEIVDNDYEGSEHDETASTPDTVNRRSGKAIGPLVQIRPFAGFGRPRVRRQANQLRSYAANRFRRPGQSSSQAKAEETVDSDVSAVNEDDNKPASKPVSRYSSRGRLPSSSKSNSNSNKPDSTEAPSSQSVPRTRAKSTSGSRSSSPKLRPSPTSSSGRQFTLREKDSSSSRPGYKRPSSSGRSSSRPSSKTETASRPRPPRLRGTSSRAHTEAPINSRRVSPSRPSSRSSPNRNTGGRRVPSQRGRVNSREDSRESHYIQPDFDGTITVTHYVPTEVTIPNVHNGVTEYRNIITAQPSTAILGPDQYNTVVGGDGRPLVVIVSDSTGLNAQGQTEVTRFLLHESETSSLTRSVTTIGGRRSLQTLIVPSTIYSVENVVSTIQPSLPTGNAPLANILLSQLLLGQLGQQNPLLGGFQQQQPQGTPTTQYNTRTTSYVTTITKQQSTVIPLTFHGKEILTTLVDSTTNVITATELITDTVVVTPTAALPGPNLNSLLLLLQQPQQQPQPNQFDPLFAAAPLLTQSNTLPGEVERRHQPVDSDYRPTKDSESYEDIDEEIEKPTKARGRKHQKTANRKKEQPAVPEESSVVTLYVSGRRPGEFSTVLSTVRIGEDASASRKRREANIVVQPSRPPSLHAGPEAIEILAGSEEPINAHAPTQSLESVVGDVGRHFITVIHP